MINGRRLFVVGEWVSEWWPCIDMYLHAQHLERQRDALLHACEALLNTTFVKDQFKYLDAGIGTNTGGGKAILAARNAIARARGED